MAVVKANGYGHGLVPVARAALQGGANWLGVARIEEALHLRRAKLECPVLVLGYTPPQRVEMAITNQISLTVWDFDQIEFVMACARNAGQQARLHLKVDTGMSRLGIQPDEAIPLAGRISRAHEIILEGVFTHFARADEIGPESNEIQEQRFLEIVEGLTGNGICPEWVHACNSAATLTRPNSRFTLVRPGLAIYGLEPSDQVRLPDDIKPALCWKTVLSQVKRLPAGQGVSYGHTYTTRQAERIGTVPVGYADGYRRIAGNQVLVAGRRVPVVGRVCMDQVLIQLDGVPEAKAGDEVVLIGSQEEECISAEEVAERWHTINYEVVCGIAARVSRIYSN
jgi:alanine racemase